MKLYLGAATPRRSETNVTRVEAPKALEYMGAICAGNLKPSGSGTRLTLWTKINRRFVAMGAAGWHISFDVLDHLLSGTPIGRIVGADAMKFAGWQRLNAEYAKQFGVKAPNWPPGGGPEVVNRGIAKTFYNQNGGENHHERVTNVRFFAGFTSSSAFRSSAISIVRLKNFPTTLRQLGLSSFLSWSFRDCGCGRAMSFDD